LNETKKIKLLVLTPTLQCGGSERFVSLVCDHINTEKFAVCLVVVNNARPFYQLRNPAIEVVDLQLDRVLFSLSAIKTVVEKFKPDIIFSTANHLNLYLAIFKNRFSKQIKFIAREASIVSISSRRAKMPLVYNWLIKKFYQRFHCIICQSQYMQHDLVTHYRIGAGKTVVIHNAVEEVLLPLTEQGKPGSEQPPTFITVARLSQEKGIERLIHAVGLLSAPFTYHIIGDGIKRDELQKLIEELQLTEKIFLVGERTKPFAGMENADLFLFGSYYDGFPNVLLEAGAHGIPVIAFNVPGGIAEIISTENGILVDDNDIIAFATSIKKALEINFNRRSIIAATTKRFAIKRMIAEIENLFLSYSENK